MRHLIVPLLILLLPASARADAVSAAAAMENPANPLVLINTETGPIFVELLPVEAPLNVANFLTLAEPAQADEQIAFPASAGYYDGMRFHRVIPGFLIQAGSPAMRQGNLVLELLPDEINADALGLGLEPVMYANGEFNSLLNIQHKEDLVAAREDEILSILANMSVKDAYAQLGFRFQPQRPGRGLNRGVLALANRGPDDNGPEFFITLSDAPHLNGRHTVIGRVVEGMEAADRIGTTAVDPLQFTSSGRLIYSIRRVN